MLSSTIDNEFLAEVAAGMQTDGSALVEPSIVVRGPHGFVAECNPDVPYYPACMIKVPLCVAACTLAERDEIQQTGIVIQKEQFAESVFPSPLEPGKVCTMRELMHLALYYSDNTAANVLIDMVGRERGTAILREFGFTCTAVRRWLVGAVMRPDPYSTGRNLHTPSDAAKILHRLADGTLPGSTSIMESLCHSSTPELGFFGLMPDDRLYYKDGYTSSVCHLGVVIEMASGESYVCVIYTNMPVSPDNYAKITGSIRKIRSRLSLQARATFSRST